MSDEALRVGNFKRMKVPRTLKKKLSKKKLSIEASEQEFSKRSASPEINLPRIISPEPKKLV
jgi:hypothetical protein